MTYNVFGGTLRLTQSIKAVLVRFSLSSGAILSLTHSFSSASENITINRILSISKAHLALTAAVRMYMFHSYVHGLRYMRQVKCVHCDATCN